MRKFRTVSPTDSNSRRKVRSVYVPDVNKRALSLSIYENPMAWSAPKVLKYKTKIPKRQEATDVTQLPTMYKLGDWMEPMLISKTDFREITPDTLLEDDRVSFFPIIPTLFAGFLAGFLFEAYGEDDPEGETFLVNDDEVMTEDACGRFYDRN